MSRLHDKINSYAIEKGIEMNHDSTTPWIETGTEAQSVNANWTNQTNGPATDYVGTGGSYGSAYFACDTARRRRLNITTSNWGRVFTDNNYSFGIWIKFGEDGYVEAQLANILTVLPLTAGGFALNYVTNGVGQPQKRFISLNQSSEANWIFKNPNGTDLEITFDRWYYVAGVKNGTSMDVYLDGVFQKTFTTMPTGSPTSVSFGHAAIAGGTPRTNFNMSNFYVAPTSVIGATQIAEIWNAGKNMSTEIKYWDGSAWTTTGPIKRWEGNVWHNVNAQEWNGSSWVTL